ncbi:hypothetical protein BIFDEN_00630 [Bifidobacterium dentium ATCC 27678]|nr:hypothetical protein BIFDEN_00630 [Bifidobacterium dentium ATCC 27678]
MIPVYPKAWNVTHLACRQSSPRPFLKRAQAASVHADHCGWRIRRVIVLRIFRADGLPGGQCERSSSPEMA